ncbi:hypothetical protein [Haloferula sp.]|uniref:hypothetical protein n=1 Tax=Haloferula sp. TaxID=2497595 RepID=UPI00329C096E
MKKLLTLMIVAAAAFIAVPQAEARPGVHGAYVSSRTSCGCAVYTQRYISYYDRCGHPVYKYRRLPISHRCRTTVYHHPKQRTIYQPRYVSPTRSYSYGTSRGRSYSSSSNRSSYSSHSRCR